MNQIEPQSYTAFFGHQLLAHGPLDKVVLQLKKHLKTHPNAPVQVFSDLTGKEMDFDLRGTEKEILQRLQVYLSPPANGVVAASGPGRPKLGVVAREISLLPRHWEWLSNQTGGASATVRRLIDEARSATSAKETLKQAQERTYKFMAAIAGDLPHYEEALRELYKKDKAKFKGHIADWPADIKDYIKKLAEPVFE